MAAVPDIPVETIVLDLDFHPEKDLIAAADIDGPVRVFSYGGEDAGREIASFQHHKKSCRRVRFMKAGSALASVSKDKSLQVVDLNQGQTYRNISPAHEKALYSLIVLDDNMVATGCDAGRLKLWDLRTERNVMDMKDCDEFISDMMADDNKRLLLATSGDGTLTAYDVRKHKMILQSELFDAEFNCLAKVKRGEKVVVGCGDGVLNVFTWGEWGNMSDRFPATPHAVESLVAVSEDVVVMGCEDGGVRAVNIHPNRVVCELGRHGDFNVESLALSRCGEIVASSSHDNKIRFWNTGDALRRAAKIDPRRKAQKIVPKTHKRPGASKGTDDFFSGLGEDEEGEADDDDDDDNEDDDDDKDDGKSGDDDGEGDSDEDGDGSLRAGDDDSDVDKDSDVEGSDDDDPSSSAK